jgi:hypothetical protein
VMGNKTDRITNPTRPATIINKIITASKVCRTHAAPQDLMILDSLK